MAPNHYLNQCYHQRCSVALTWQQFRKKCSSTLLVIICSETKLLKLLPHLRGANGLKLLKKDILWGIGSIRSGHLHEELITPKFSGRKLWTGGDLGHRDMGVPGCYKFLFAPNGLSESGAKQCQQNVGFQIWCLFYYIYNVFKNMFNMSLMIMW